MILVAAPTNDNLVKASSVGMFRGRKLTKFLVPSCLDCESNGGILKSDCGCVTVCSVLVWLCDCSLCSEKSSFNLLYVLIPLVLKD